MVIITVMIVILINGLSYIIEVILFYRIFNGNYVLNNVTYKPAIHLAVQTVYTTTCTILEHLH